MGGWNAARIVGVMQFSAFVPVNARVAHSPLDSWFETGFAKAVSDSPLDKVLATEQITRKLFGKTRAASDNSIASLKQTPASVERTAMGRDFPFCACFKDACVKTSSMVLLSVCLRILFESVHVDKTRNLSVGIL